MLLQRIERVAEQAKEAAAAAGDGLTGAAAAAGEGIRAAADKYASEKKLTRRTPEDCQS